MAGFTIKRLNGHYQIFFGTTPLDERMLDRILDAIGHS